MDKTLNEVLLLGLYKFYLKLITSFVHSEIETEKFRPLLLEAEAAVTSLCEGY